MVVVVVPLQQTPLPSMKTPLRRRRLGKSFRLATHVRHLKAKVCHSSAISHLQFSHAVVSSSVFRLENTTLRPSANQRHLTACTLGIEKSYSVGVEVSVGMDLGLDFAKVLSAGIDAQVAIQTTEGTTDTNQQECSGPWACSMTITPSVQEVAGTQHAWVDCPSVKKEFPYTVQFPIKNGDHLPVQHEEPCQCRNFPGFDEHNPDAPKPCPNDC